MFRQIREIVQEKIRLRFGKSGAAESVSDAAGERTGVAGRLYVHVGIADHHQLARRQVEIAQQSVKSHGIRLFLFETVAPVNKPKMTGHVETGDDCLAELHGFIG